MGRATMLIAREEWGAAPPKYPVTMTDFKDLFIVHHAASKGIWPTMAEEIAAMRFWQAYHQGPAMRGADLYYGAVIFPSGRAYEGRYGGWWANNGGAYGCNVRGFGVCLAGDFTNTFPTMAALETLVKLGLEAREVLRVDPGRYWGHRDCAVYHEKNRGNSCPGEMLYNWLPVLRKTVAAGNVEEEEEEVKIFAHSTGLKSLDGWHIYNVPSVNRGWWLDISNEHDAPVRVRVYLNAQHKPTQKGGYYEGTVPNTRADAPGLHKRLVDMCPGLAEWCELSVHAEKPLSILVGN